MASIVFFLLSLSSLEMIGTGTSARSPIYFKSFPPLTILRSDKFWACLISARSSCSDLISLDCHIYSFYF